jgi:ribosomal protein S18 acetylase RimI-like enzyme
MYENMEDIMSYTRYNESGHYIFGGTDYVDFSGVPVSDDEVDVFLYKLLGYTQGGDDEFWERYHHGEMVIRAFESGVVIEKMNRHSSDLEAKTQAVAALAAEIWREHFTPIIGAEQVEYMLDKFQSSERMYEDIKKSAYTYFTARHIKADKLVGYTAVCPKENHLFLSKLYVHKDYRRLGIARCFRDTVAAFCRLECGYDRIRLTVNKHNDGSVQVYQKWGFETVESVKTDIGAGFFMDDYVMEWAVPPVRRSMNI